MTVPVDLDAIEARWELLMGLESRRHFPSSYRVVKFDVPALVAVLRELRGLALVDGAQGMRLSAHGWSELVLRLTGGRS